MSEEESRQSLGVLFLILALLIISAFIWFMLSSCMGEPILQVWSNMWSYLLESSRAGGYSTTSARRRRALGEEESWELEFRGRG
ncbi:hypothetical protein HGRIS_008556 [Hohenbuehelia grisea]|uniref:ATP synthase F0 subunit 8 n=1 Tax=Hohenbuehelia grisea TaxID=104357 RepID=A0ABR3J8B7_9AGAR